MKNPYAKFVKYLEKQDSIFLQRSGDYVYLTDGKIVLKVPGTVYMSMLRPMSGILPDAWDDCKGVKRSYDPAIRIDKNDGMDIEKACEDLSSEKSIAKSRFILELPPKGKGKKSEKARLFFCDGEVIAVSENFIDVFSDCLICERWTGAGKWNTPLVQKTDDFMLVMFPIRVDKAEFQVWKDVEV